MFFDKMEKGTMISLIAELKDKYGIEIIEGERFKQALYNGRLTDTQDQLRDKIEFAITHYPKKDIVITTCESDETSPEPFAYAVITPAL